MADKKTPVIGHTLSHRGLVRGNNEDRVLIRDLPTGKNRSAYLAVLADGVGGHTAGEVAAQIAVDTIAQHLAENLPLANDPAAVIEKAILAANQAILENTAINPHHAGMGTTCVCALVARRTLFAAHMGDSRLYLFRKRTLHLLTKDHTMLSELRGDGFDRSEENDRDHPLAHVLSRYLGSTHTLKIDQHIHFDNKAHTSLPLYPKDILLLCSDGISDLLDDEEIAHILATCTGRKRGQTLILRALEKGGHDNASAAVLEIR